MITKTHKELNDNGINGSGEKVFAVYTINTETNQVVWIEKFDNLPEAEAWIEWA